MFIVNNIFKFILSVVVCEFAGIVGAFYTTPSITTWYASLNKPPFNPPNSIFAPVWTTLYFLMGVSLFLIWKNRNPIKKKIKSKGLQFFFAQLLINIIWSIIFFSGHSPIGGLFVIILLAFLIFGTIQTFYKVNKTAAFILYPYLAWVLFASLLNLSIVILNF